MVKAPVGQHCPRTLMFLSGTFCIHQSRTHARDTMGGKHLQCVWDAWEPVDMLFMSRSGKHLQYKSHSYMTEGSLPQPALAVVTARILGQAAHKRCLICWD